jgi:hypothetical protein
MAELAPCWKWCGSKTSCLFGTMQTRRSKNSRLLIYKANGKIITLLVWQQKWLFVGSGWVAKIAAYFEVCKGVVPKLAAC